MTDVTTERELRRIMIRVGLSLAAANLVGAVLVFVYLAIISPVPDSISHAQREAVIAANVTVFLPYMLLVTGGTGVLIDRRLRQLTRWAAEGRPPTADEVDRTLRLPRDLLRYTFGNWLAAAVVFGALQIHLDAQRVLVVRVVSGILLAGLISSALGYLLTEREARPAAALVLSFGVPEQPRGPGILPRLLLSWLLGSALPLVSVGLTQLFRTPAERQHLAGPIWFLVTVGVFTGGLAMVIAAKSVYEPIRALSTTVRDVENGRLDVAVPVDDASEVGRLQAGFNEMVAGLRERGRLEDLFGRHVGEDVARQAMQRGIALGGELREASVLFVDVVGSTAMAQTRPPEEVVATLNAFFGAVVEAVRAEGGWVNKFAGDGALCVFGAPADLPGHPAAALRAARRLRDLLRVLDGGIDAGIGVSSGRVTAGNVGAEERFEYTVIGDPVNEASRLSELAKSLPERLAASAAAVQAAGPEEAVHWRLAGRRKLRGRSAPTGIYVPVP